MSLKRILIFLVLLFVSSSVALAQPGAPVSDDFNTYRFLEEWRIVNPAGTADVRLLGTNSPDAWLQIDVPGGRPQDIWYTGPNAPRLVQTIRNIDFEVETRFESSLTRNGQSQGIAVEQDQGNFLQVFFTLENNQIVLIAAASSNYNLNLDAPYARVDIGPAGTSPLWLRLRRLATDWIASYSLDGINYTDAPAFSHRINVVSVGLYAGVNSFFGDAPAFTMVADYFFNTASPIESEDGAQVEDLFEPQILSLDPLPYDTSIVLNWQTDEPATATIDYGATGNFELGTIAIPDLTVNHSVELPGLEPGVPYNVRITSGDTLGNEGAAEPFTVTTLTAPPAIPNITVWYGETQSFGLLGLPQRFVNILGRVEDPDAGDVITMSYSVNDSEDFRLSVGADARRLAGQGDFNIEVPLESMRDGENEIIIKASDRYGNRSNIAMSVFYDSRSIWSIPSSIDWSAVQNIQGAVQVVDGNWEVTPDGVRTAEPGWRRMLNIGDLSWTEYEVLVPLTVHALVPPDATAINAVDPEPFVGVIPRWTGYYTWDESQPAVGSIPVGAVARYMWRSAVQANNAVDGLELLDGSLAPAAQDLSQQPLELNTPYLMRVRVLSGVDGGAFYAVRLWKADEDEPMWWNIAATTPPNGTTAGSVALVAHRADVTFGNVQVTGLTPDAYVLQAYDNTPPECTVVVLGTGANLRAGAGPNFGVVRSVSGGEEIAINGEGIGADGALWYRASEDLAWMRADLVTLDPECEGVLSVTISAS
jgi:hypothetical protein